MNRILNYLITSAEQELTIQDFLLSKGYSRKLISSLKKTNFSILLNGKWVYTRDRIYAGDTLKITMIEDEINDHITPVPLSLDIIYEDEDILIVNKASDTPIHPSLNNYENTLANSVAYYYSSKNESIVFRCINRLDRDTTGLTIIAKNKLSSCILSKMMKQRKIHREYLAVVSGEIDQEGKINAPIARKENSAIERIVDFDNGESAITNYARIYYNKNNGYSLVSLKLETGRTHQIRVHMKYIGHPLPGDFLYNPEDIVINRQALHSHKLTFIHPVTQKEMEFSTPLPDDMHSIAFQS